MENKKLSKKVINFFGIGDLGFQLYINVELFYFAAFLTDYAKFPIAVAGTILTITGLIDLLWVPVTGIIIEKSNLKWGKYRSWLIIAPPFIIIAFILMFSKVGSILLATTFVILGFAIKTLFQDLVYSAQIGMISDLSNDPAERTLLGTRRAQYLSAGAIIFSYFGLGAIVFLGDRTSPLIGFSLGAGFWAMIGAFCYFVSFKVSKGISVSGNGGGNTAKQKEKKLSIKEMFTAVFTNKPLIIIILADGVRYLSFFLVTAVAFYYFKTVLNNIPLMATYLVLINFASFFGASITNVVTKHLGKKTTYILGQLCYSGCLILAYFFGSNAYAFIILLVIANFGFQTTNALITSMFADTVVYNEYNSKKDARGFIMSMICVPIKFGAIFRSLVLGAGLAAIGYVADTAPTDEVIKGISQIMTLLPGLLMLFSAAIIFFCYHLNEEKVIAMTEAISQRSKNPE